MRTSAAVISLTFISCVAVMGGACSSSTGKRSVPDGSAGGLNSSGGGSGTEAGSSDGSSILSGGETSSGGATGPGGVTSIADSTGTGGMAGSGGTAGAGGVKSTAGSIGTGGTAGTSLSGGSKGTGGASTLSSVLPDASADARIVRTGDPCRSGEDCRGALGLWLQCLAPGESAGCGMCRTGPDECSTDADCVTDSGVTTGKRICATAPSSYCYCMGKMICQPGCRSNTDCPEGSACNAQHACQATCVPGVGPCETNYVCGNDGFCKQMSCTTDTECSGACVKGRCYSGLGKCQPMPA